MGEPQNENDLFFVCGLIEYIARKTKNTKKYVVQKLGKDRIQKIYNLAEVYHSENIEKVSDEFIEQVLIGEINPETNTRDIEIEFNLIRLVPCLKEYLPGISRVSVY